MPKFYGMIGYARQRMTAPGVASYSDVEERPYYGDFVKHTIKDEVSSEVLNDNIVMQDDISIMADEYAYVHASKMKYVVINDVKWKIRSISFSRPRITISLGGVYNEQ